MRTSPLTYFPVRRERGETFRHQNCTTDILYLDSFPRKTTPVRSMRGENLHPSLPIVVRPAELCTFLHCTPRFSHNMSPPRAAGIAYNVWRQARRAGRRLPTMNASQPFSNDAYQLPATAPSMERDQYLLPNSARSLPQQMIERRACRCCTQCPKPPPAGHKCSAAVGPGTARAHLLLTQIGQDSSWYKLSVLPGNATYLSIFYHHHAHRL